MIDLHMHTSYSDGTDSLIELLKKANKANLEIISITDHNSVKAYLELEQLDYKKIFKRKNNTWNRIKYKNFKRSYRSLRI